MSKNEKTIIEQEITDLLNKNLYKKITTQIIPFKKFYIAEEYHQDYKKKNPNNFYIMKVSAPRINKFKMNFKNLIK
jgi:peptide-methionine (S)-S-oxide reductase